MSDPLQIICKNCGAAAEYKIEQQSYVCTYCGEVSGIKEACDSVAEWRELQKDSIEAARSSMEVLSCSSCGAAVVFEEGEASEKCDFCGGALVRGGFEDSDSFPEMIIPFAITEKEAKKHLLEWADSSRNSKTAELVRKKTGSLKAYYMPYQIVKGPVFGKVSRDTSERRYNCGGFLEETAVSTSRQMDNQVLNAAEPFDFTKLVPFEYGYIAGHKVRLSDISGRDTERLVRKEAAEEFAPTVEKTMQTQDIRIDLRSGTLMSLPVLLPVYFIKSGRLTAAVNGQTGRVAVTSEEHKKNRMWAIEPAVMSLLALAIVIILCGFDFDTAAMFGMFFALIFFGVFSNGRNSIIKRIIYSGQKDETIINHETVPVFYENIDGREKPVELRFYTPGRIISLIFKMAVTVFLPVIPALAVTGVRSVMQGHIAAGSFHPEYGWLWYIFAFVLCLVFWANGARRSVYDHPFIYEKLDNGEKKLVGSRRDRRISVLEVLGVTGKNRFTFKEGGAAMVLVTVMLGAILIISTVIITVAAFK